MSDVEQPNSSYSARIMGNTWVTDSETQAYDHRDNAKSRTDTLRDFMDDNNNHRTRGIDYMEDGFDPVHDRYRHLHTNYDHGHRTYTGLASTWQETADAIIDAKKGITHIVDTTEHDIQQVLRDHNLGFAKQEEAINTLCAEGYTHCATIRAEYDATITKLGRTK